MEKEYSVKFPFFLKSIQSKINEKKILKSTKNHHNCLQHESVLKIFVFSYFEYSQIWLNIVMDDLEQHRLIEKKKRPLNTLKLYVTMKRLSDIK